MGSKQNSKLMYERNKQNNMLPLLFIIVGFTFYYMQGVVLQSLGSLGFSPVLLSQLDRMAK